MRSTSKTRDMFVFYMRVEIGFCCVVFVLQGKLKNFFHTQSVQAFVSNMSHLAQHKLLSFEFRRRKVRLKHLTSRPTQTSLFRVPTQKFLHSRACAFVRASLPPRFYFQRIILRKVSSSGLRRRRPCLLRFRAGVFGARGRLRRWIPRRCLYLFANKSRARRRPV